MASLKFCLIISLALYSSLLLSHTVKADEEDILFRGINNYRASLNLSPLTENDRVDCLAEEIADQFKNQPCTNATGPNTPQGTEPKFSDYPTLFAKCQLNPPTAIDGVILPLCVPNLIPDTVVLSNFTQSRYSGFLNDTKFTMAGIGTEDNWIVVVLTANTQEGRGGTPEEDILFRGINNYRASLNLSPLTENDRVDCLAEEIADQFDNQSCTNATGPNTPPGTEPKFSDYPTLLAKCQLNHPTAIDGVILPLCVPSIVPDTVILSNFTQSRYSGFLNDTKFTMAGVGTEDNWIVVVLTTNTPGGGGGTPGTPGGTPDTPGGTPGGRGGFLNGTTSGSPVIKVGLVGPLTFLAMGALALI